MVEPVTKNNKQESCKWKNTLSSTYKPKDIDPLNTTKQ